MRPPNGRPTLVTGPSALTPTAQLLLYIALGKEGSHHGNHPHRRRVAVPVRGRRLLLEQQARVAPEQRSPSMDSLSMARPSSYERTRPLQALWNSPSWGWQEGLVSEPRLRPPRRRLVAVALAGASRTADRGLPEVLICCDYHEKSLRQVLLSGRGFCACRSLTGTLHRLRNARPRRAR
jgi:hypothetical protein